MRRRPGVVAPSPGKPEDKDGAPSQCQEYTDEINCLELPKICLLEVADVVITRVFHSQSPITLDLLQGHEEQDTQRRQTSEGQI